MRTLRPLHDAISVHLSLQHLNCIITRQRFDDEPNVYKKAWNTAYKVRRPGLWECTHHTPPECLHMGEEVAKMR